MNGNTRLSEALAANSAILDYVVSLNPHDFERLHNPILRRVMPPRITLRRIAKMVGIPEREFVAKINQLAGLPDEDEPIEPHKSELLPQSSPVPPDWLAGVEKESLTWVNVLPIDAEGGDPMPPINIAINGSKPGEVVGIKHKWEPQPFYDIWHARGFQFWSTQIGPDEWHIFVYKPR